MKSKQQVLILRNIISLKFEYSIGSDCANAQVCQINFVSFHRIFRLEKLYND